MVLACNPVRLAETATGELPLPMLVPVVVEPRDSVVPYSKETVVAAPLGVTVAFNVAVVSVMLAEEMLFMDGWARLEAAPVVKRDSKAPCKAKPLASVAVLSIRRR